MQVKEAIDRAISVSSDYQSFKEALEKDGIEVLEGARITFHKIGVESRNGRAAKCRGDRIGEDYTKERILARLAAPQLAKDAAQNAPIITSAKAENKAAERQSLWQLRREKIAATKGLAEALIMLRSEGVQYEEDIAERVNELTEKAAQTRERMKELSDKSQQYKTVAKYLLAFQKYSPLKVEYESSEACSLRYLSQPHEDGSDFVCPVQVHISTEIRLNRVNNNQSGVVLNNGFFDSFIRECQLYLAVINDQHPVKVCTRFDQAGFDRIA